VELQLALDCAQTTSPPLERQRILAEKKLIYLLRAEVSEAKEGFMVAMNKLGNENKT
jgi:hypothetical protein